LQDLSHELQTLRAQHTTTSEELAQTQAIRAMEREHAAMREEDNQIK